MSELFAKPYKLSDVATALLTDFTSDAAAVIAAIDGIEQTELKTDLAAIFDTVVPDLLAFTADRRILLIISDGEHTIDADKQAILDAAATFKQGGGVIIVVGVRASGVGYDLLERIATGGYFINATPDNAEDAILGLNYLKSLLCAGDCAVAGGDYQSLPERNFHEFTNFEVISGKVNLLGPGLLDLLPGNGLYVELAEAGEKGTIRTSSPVAIVAGRTYRVNFSAAGNQRGAVAGQGVKVYVREVGADDADPNIFEQTVFPDWDDNFQTFSFSFIPHSDASVRLNFEQIGTGSAPDYGNLLDNVKLEEVSTLISLLDDNFDDENSTFIAPSCGGNAALPPIAKPDDVQSENITTFGEELVDAGPECYRYGITYVTAEGETEAKIQGDDDDGFVYAQQQYLDGTIKLTLPVPTDARVISKRIWRNLGLPFNDPPDNSLYLLAEVPAGDIIYLDQERSAEFEARYDNSINPPTVNTTEVAENDLGYGSDCNLYECAAEPPGAQLPDSVPLPDIESGYTPPQQYTSTKTVCVECPDGQQNDSGTNLIPVMTSNTSPSGEALASVQPNPFFAWRAFDGFSTDFNHDFWFAGNGIASGWLGYDFGSGNSKIVTRYEVVCGFAYQGPKDFTFEGSNNGSTWDVLDTRVNQTWYQLESRSFSITNSTSYRYYRINVSSTITSNLSVMELRMFGGASTRVCKTETRTSYVSQADADALATAAATAAANAELNCNQVFTATESFTAVCPFNAFGQPVTKSATRTSSISLADAQAQALAAAQLEAEAAIDCTGSNNSARTVINDNTKATPYPSVKFVSGLTGTITKVTVALNGLTHPSPDDIKILLLAPDGTTNCLLMANCGGVALDGNGISNVNLVLDQAAGSALPDTTAIASGTYRPAQYGAVGGPGLLPAPVPNSIVTYGASLDEFNGIEPNGSWSLWIFDDLSVFDGSLNSWNLTITVA